jgi:hypothetical protein
MLKYDKYIQIHTGTTGAKIIGDRCVEKETGVSRLGAFPLEQLMPPLSPSESRFKRSTGTMPVQRPLISSKIPEFQKLSVSE